MACFLHAQQMVLLNDVRTYIVIFSNAWSIRCVQLTEGFLNTLRRISAFCNHLWSIIQPLGWGSEPLMVSSCGSSLHHNSLCKTAHFSIPEMAHSVCERELTPVLRLTEALQDPIARFNWNINYKNSMDSVHWRVQIYLVTTKWFLETWIKAYSTIQRDSLRGN